MQLLNRWIQNCLLDCLCGLCSSFSFFGLSCRSDFTLFFNSLVSVHLEHVTEFVSLSWIVNADVADSQIAAVKWLIHCFIEREREERKKANCLFPINRLWNHHSITTALKCVISIIFLCLQHSGSAAEAWLWFPCMKGQQLEGENMQLCIPCKMTTEDGLH